MRFARRQALLAFALAALACAASTGAGASPSRVSKDASFCSVAKHFAESLQKAPTTQSLVASQSQLKTNFTRLSAAKGSLLAAAPGSLKGDVNRIIGFYAVLGGDLAKANWNFTGLAASPAVMHALVADANRTKPSFLRLKRYLNTTCKY